MRWGILFLFLSVSAQGQFEEADYFRLEEEVTSAFGSLLQPDSPFYTWVRDINFIEVLLSQYVQKYATLGSVSFSYGPRVALMCRQQVNAVVASLLGNRQLSSEPNTFDVSPVRLSVDVLLEEKTFHRLFIDLIANVDLSVTIPQHLQEQQWFRSWVTDQSYIGQKNVQDKERIIVSLPVKVSDQPDAFNLGTIAESELVFAAAIETDFVRVDDKLGVYSHINFRANVRGDQIAPTQFASRFRVLSHVETGKSIQNILDHVTARMCVLDAGVLLPEQNIAFEHGKVASLVTNHSEYVRSRWDALVQTFANKFISLDVFFPLMEHVVHNRLSKMRMNVMTPGEYARVPDRFHCEPEVKRRQDALVQSLESSQKGMDETAASESNLQKAAVLAVEAGVGIKQRVKFAVGYWVDYGVNLITGKGK